MAPEQQGYLIFAIWLAVLFVLRGFQKSASIETQQRLKTPITLAGAVTFMAVGYWMGIDKFGFIVMALAVVLLSVVWIRGSRICNACGKWTTPGYFNFMFRPRLCKGCGAEFL